MKKKNLVQEAEENLMELFGTTDRDEIQKHLDILKKAISDFDKKIAEREKEEKNQKT